MTCLFTEEIDEKMGDFSQESDSSSKVDTATATSTI
jgi:hypothetical protein